MRLIASIAVGGALGSVLRYWIGTFIQTRAGVEFPTGTLLVNITGSLLIGFLIRYALETPAVTPEVRAFLTTGICGGYTTFSAFSYETAVLIEDGDYRRAGVYVTLSVALSLLGTMLGFAAARELLAARRA